MNFSKSLYGIFSDPTTVRSALNKRKEYYHVARPHQGLDGDTPVLQTKQPQILGPSKLISIPVLGGLHHRYIRVAA